MPRRQTGRVTRFGARLRALRTAAGLNQSQLAERAGCNSTTIVRLENETQEPAWPVVLDLAEALGVTPNDFIARGDEPAPEPLKRGRPPLPKLAAAPPPEKGKRARRPDRRGGAR
jgi:transcriptional regulator with XRE-family HTH domain